MSVILSAQSANGTMLRPRDDAHHGRSHDAPDGFEQTVRGRRALAASLQATGNPDPARTNTDEAVAFAEVALFQAGVAVQPQATVSDQEQTVPGKETLAASTAATAVSAGSRSVPSGGLDPASALPASSLVFQPGPVVTGATVMAGTLPILSQPDSALQTSAMIGDAPQSAELPSEAEPLVEPARASLSRITQRSYTNLPVVITLGDGAEETTVFVRVDGMSEADETEFERRTQEEFDLAGRSLRQLRINGRDRPVEGVV